MSINQIEDETQALPITSSESSSKMKFSLSTAAAPAQALFRPMLFAALGLHAFLLFTPFPEARQKPSENQETPVKITQLPTTKSSVSRKESSKVAKPALPKMNRATANPIIQKKPDQPKPLAQTKEEVAPPAKGQAVNKASESAANGFQDFPHYQPSTPDCFGKGLGDNCRVASSPFASVATFYQSEPIKKGFKVALAEDNGSTKIFTVTAKNGQTLFLSLLADDPTSVVLLSEQKIGDLAMLKGSVTPPAEYYELLAYVLPESDRADNPATTASPEQFTQPQMFYNIVSEAELQQGMIPDFRSGMDGAPKLALGQAPTTLYSVTLEPELKTIFQEVTKQGQYGGGDLYRLKKGSTTIYLNLIPVKGQQGTIVITWLKDPTKS